jgi:hypothetical protein
LLNYTPGIKSKLLKLRAGNRDDDPTPTVPRRRLDGSYIRRELEESLKRLKRDRVDLYLVHEPDQFDLDDEALETFTALRREGVVGAFGLAYGRSVTATPDFGTVIQSRYRSESPPGDDNKTRIFHGVLRHGWNEACSRAEHASGVNGYIVNVFKANPTAGIVFSADSARQIYQLTASLT